MQLTLQSANTVFGYPDDRITGSGLESANAITLGDHGREFQSHESNDDLLLLRQTTIYPVRISACRNMHWLFSAVRDPFFSPRSQTNLEKELAAFFQVNARLDVVLWIKHCIAAL